MCSGTLSPPSVQILLLGFTSYPHMHPEMELEKMTCNFWNAKILPTSFWTCELGYGCQGSLYVSPSGGSLSLSCLLLSSTPRSALASRPLLICVLISPGAHHSPCTVSPLVVTLTSLLFPLAQHRVSSLQPPCQSRGRFVHASWISRALTLRRSSGNLGHTGEQNQPRSLPLWGLPSSRGTQTRRLNK